VRRFSSAFAAWPDAVIDWKTGDGKGTNLLLSPDKELSCAEVEVVRLLRAFGLEALWIDNFGSAPQVWRWASGSDKALPGQVKPRHTRIKEAVRARTGKAGGCWDVVAWRADELAYIECKGPGDAIKPGQRAWRVAGESVDPGVEWILLEWLPA
jgi:hypothetical protein